MDIRPAAAPEMYDGERLGRIGSAAVGPGRDASPESLERVCKEMESLFIHQLFKEMRRTVPKDGLMGESHAQDVFTGMHDAELARQIAGAGGLGLARMLVAQLLQTKESDAGPLKVSGAGTDNVCSRHETVVETFRESPAATGARSRREKE